MKANGPGEGQGDLRSADEKAHEALDRADRPQAAGLGRTHLTARAWRASEPVGSREAFAPAPRRPFERPKPLSTLARGCEAGHRD